MKKVLLILSIFTLVSCSKQDEAEKDEYFNVTYYVKYESVGNYVIEYIATDGHTIKDLTNVNYYTSTERLKKIKNSVNYYSGVWMQTHEKDYGSVTAHLYALLENKDTLYSKRLKY